MSEQLVYTLETNRFHEGRTDLLVLVLPGGVAPADTSVLFLEVGEGAWNMDEAVVYAKEVSCVVFIIKPDDSVYHKEVFFPAFRRIATVNIRPLAHPEGYVRTMEIPQKLAILEAWFFRFFEEMSAPHRDEQPRNQGFHASQLHEENSEWNDYLMPVESC